MGEDTRLTPEGEALALTILLGTHLKERLQIDEIPRQFIDFVSDLNKAAVTIGTNPSEGYTGLEGYNIQNAAIHISIDLGKTPEQMFGRQEILIIETVKIQDSLNTLFPKE